MVKQKGKALNLRSLKGEARIQIFLALGRC